MQNLKLYLVALIFGGFTFQFAHAVAAVTKPLEGYVFVLELQQTPGAYLQLESTSRCEARKPEKHDSLISQQEHVTRGKTGTKFKSDVVFVKAMCEPRILALTKDKQTCEKLEKTLRNCAKKKKLIDECLKQAATEKPIDVCSGLN